jgi:hypothetical protein
MFPSYLIKKVSYRISTEKILASWLVQIKGAGHALLGQYPEDKINRILQTFRSTTCSI